MKAANLTFNETDLKQRLEALPGLKMVAFAAACAERLMPTYTRYSEKAMLQEEKSSLYRETLEMIWGCLLGQEVSKQLIDNLEQKCLAAIPSGDDSFRFGEPYAEDAGAVVTFAVKALLALDAKQAVWAARRVYEAMDNFVASALQNSSQMSEQQKIIASQLIQNELARQKYDLEELEATSSIDAAVVISLRDRSQREALKIFGLST